MIELRLLLQFGSINVFAFSLPRSRAQARYTAGVDSAAALSHD